MDSIDNSAASYKKTNLKTLKRRNDNTPAAPQQSKIEVSENGETSSKDGNEEKRRRVAAKEEEDHIIVVEDYTAPMPVNMSTVCKKTDRRPNIARSPCEHTTAFQNMNELIDNSKKIGKGTITMTLHQLRTMVVHPQSRTLLCGHRSLNQKKVDSIKRQYTDNVEFVSQALLSAPVELITTSSELENHFLLIDVVDSTTLYTIDYEKKEYHLCRSLLREGNHRLYALLLLNDLELPPAIADQPIDVSCTVATGDDDMEQFNKLYESRKDRFVYESLPASNTLSVATVVERAKDQKHRVLSSANTLDQFEHCLVMTRMMASSVLRQDPDTFEPDKRCRKRAFVSDLLAKMFAKGLITTTSQNAVTCSVKASLMPRSARDSFRMLLQVDDELNISTSSLFENAYMICDEGSENDVVAVFDGLRKDIKEGSIVGSAGRELCKRMKDAAAPFKEKMRTEAETLETAATRRAAAERRRNGEKTAEWRKTDLLRAVGQGLEHVCKRRVRSIEGIRDYDDLCSAANIGHVESPLLLVLMGSAITEADKQYGDLIKDVFKHDNVSVFFYDFKCGCICSSLTGNDNTAAKVVPHFKTISIKRTTPAKDDPFSIIDYQKCRLSVGPITVMVATRVTPATTPNQSKVNNTMSEVMSSIGWTDDLKKITHMVFLGF